MAYFRQYRKNQAELSALADSSSGDDENDKRIPEALLESDSSSESNVSDRNTGAQVLPMEAALSDSDFDTDLDFMSSDDSDEKELNHYCDTNLSEQLASWACKHSHTRASVNELLDMLRKQGMELPKDARTLMHTPRTISVTDKCGGQYSYFGIGPGLQRMLSKNVSYKDNFDSIALQVNVDGIPLFKSTSHQFWPILVKCHTFQPFVVALFYGKGKPDSVDEFLRDFLEEYRALKESGFTHDTKTFTLTIQAFLCDAPARSFMKCTKGHTGFNSCERCTIHGDWNGRVVFHSDCLLPKRTDEQFNHQRYRPDHQLAKSPLIEYQLLPVTGFPLDYMHLVCLGVVRRGLVYLKRGPRLCKLSNQQLKLLSAELLSFTGRFPSEFARQPRSLLELDRWKATELRQFLLYSGPLVLKEVVTPKVYNHFLLLHVALSILLQSHDGKRNAYLPYARELLECYVKESKDTYGETFCSYNVHNLVHLADDVENFQCSLDKISCFPFENHLQSLKRLVRNAQNPIAQVGKRLTEIDISGSEKQTTSSQHIQRKYISSKPKNMCFLLTSEDFAFVRMNKEDDFFECDVIGQHHLSSFYKSPCDSKLLNIVFLKDFRRARRKTIHYRELHRKAVCLPYHNGHVLMALLHGDETH